MDEKDISRKQRLISYSIIYLTAIYPLHPAWSSVITPSDKTIKISQQNTVPIINIATPNDIGVSHNQFHSFNVGKQGVVLNNATIPINTQLAKKVNANANLKGNAAHLIINEVVGNGHSQLLGKLEVAGQQADVLIANPNGITCDGCSFINTPAITLTTGKPQFSPQGAYSAIEVKKGSVVIGKQGMNTELQNYADIISRSIELNGKINAKNLSLMQGNNRIDFEKGTVNSLNGEGIKSTISIDTKALGGMYANQIRLVSTEKGVGVNLSDVQTTQNSMNLTVDGKITFNGNIQSEKDINVSSKELQINRDTKLKAKRDITLATHALTNHSEIISEKDMRLFADKLTNKGEKAVIQAKDNLWIQKNAQGDPSSLIENQSATIKTEKGDLIIRTKKLVNESITPLFKEIKQEPDSKLSINIGNHLLSPFRSPTDDFLLVILFPELKDFSDKKWFDILDLKNNGGVNVERLYFEKSEQYVPSVISSGNNLYIQSNEFINNQSRIIANNNLIATGSNAKLYYYRSGYLNKWDVYSHDNSQFYYRDDIVKYKLDEAKFNKISHFVPFVKTGSHYEFSVNDVSDYIIKAGNNLVLDFKNSIDLERKLPSTGKEIKKFRGLSGFENAILAKNILLNANNMNISLNLTAKDSLSIIADKNININNSELLADENINLTATDTINFENIDVSAKYFTTTTKKGDISHLFNPTTFYTLKGVKSPYIDISEKIDFHSGKSIYISNVIINKPNEINLSALEDIKINRDESFLFNLVPFIRDSGYIPGFLINMGIWESNHNIVFTSGKDIISQGIKYNSNKAIIFNAGQDIFLSSKSIKDADPFFSDIHYPQLQSKLFSDNNLILNTARDIDLTSTILNSKDKVIVLAGRNIKLGANAYSAIKDPHENAQDIQYATATITGNKGISIASSGTLITEGSSFKSEGDVTISSGDNIQLGSVRTHFRKESGSYLEELRKQVSTEINSGNNLTLLSEGSILFQASKLTANKEIDIAAKGGFLYAKAMEESSYYKEEKKKCNRWTLCITKKKYTKTFYNTNNKVTEFIANSNINLFAKDDITLEATKIDTAKNAKLTSKTGKVNFKAVKNTAFKQVISGGNVKGAIIGGLAAEIAAISLGDNTIKAEEWHKKSESQAQFVRLFGGIAGGIFTGEPGGVYSGARGAENSFRYNYLSHHQQKLMEKELSAETNYFKKTAIYLKWLSADIGQDTGFNAGLVAGIPTGLYETIEGLASLATNPLETYQAIKAVIQSDNAFDTLTQAVKQSYIDRIEKLEAEYQKAGVSGSFNAGVESGKLIFDLVGLFAGGAGVVKGSSQLIAKTSAKITTRNKLISSIKSGQVGLSDPDAVDLIKADMLKNFYSYKAPSGIIAGYIDKKGIYYVTEGNHRMVAAVEIYNEIGEIKYINQLLDNGSWTKIENPIVDSKPLPVRKIK
ncbi:filamentous hemagglutinin N-terminal domain-containing protein [Proteus columbae]|uniref:Filamentous hemagglutinin N-terminal domain-containing protein n=1 Tax=Proteus columbae TaxID=1987580 RepID=A0A6I7DA34_9GAMM|nr:filamentous hemagglutinin N-terminal domain-containing protein [Proteus columbae]QHN09918.1 filamentous hemagglutinin N-terminal domain-containing protein [Proteus columbae]